MSGEQLLIGHGDLFIGDLPPVPVVPADRRHDRADCRYQLDLAFFVGRVRCPELLGLEIH
jgi:hypothetical protein